jgi:TRAP-type C4-dicarboxylate transport system substrate-binding protein
MVFPNGYYGFKLHEVGKTFVVAGLGAPAAVGMTINSNTWKKLPSEVQKIIEEVAREYETENARIEAEGAKAAIENMKKAGVNVVHLSDAERRAWAEAVRDLPNEAAREANKRGLPGSQAFKSLFKHVKEQGYQFPIDYPIN